ncbi:MAG: 50S ribosomal protein L9 [Candidatus Paceibacteria bacterium]
MKIILLTDVKKVGRKHEVVSVADGHAQNVLLPQRLALPATPGNMKRFENAQSQAADRKAMDEALLAKNIETLRGKTLTITARTNDAGTIFETLHAEQVLEALEHEFGITLPESSVSMKDIKKTGEYTVVLSGGGTSYELPVTVTGA